MKKDKISCFYTQPANVIQFPACSKSANQICESPVRTTVLPTRLLIQATPPAMVYKRVCQRAVLQPLFCFVSCSS